MNANGSMDEFAPIADSLLEGIAGGELDRETAEIYLQSMANAKKDGLTLDQVLWSVSIGVHDPRYREECLDFVRANWDNV